MFVRVREGEGVAFGLGKLVNHAGDVCTVEFFDAPTSAPEVHDYEASALEPSTIPGQTRAYHFNMATHAWEIGRVLDDHGDSILIQFPNGVTRHLPANDVYVRWARRIADPTPFLANRINESPRFSDARNAFVHSQMAQRGVALGMSALLSSAIELEAHQVEVVRRVLQDPVQRYLLADEVGLGKTIEAGVLIRQCVLDSGGAAQVLVMAPRVLVAQWRAELTCRFFLGPYLDRTVHVVAHEDATGMARQLQGANLLVVDEAHHLTGAESEAGRQVFQCLAEAARTAERVLLLSATPALHNERGFLEMLHLLDPTGYPLEGEAAFRRKVQDRQAIAEIVAGLIPQNVFYLDQTLDQLAQLFPDDALLQEHAAALRTVLDDMPSEDDPGLIEALGRLQTHVSEIYRLHRRILRHRRRTVSGLTPERSGAKPILYDSTERAALTAELELWRSEVAGDADGLERYLPVLERVLQYPVHMVADPTTAGPDLLRDRPFVFEDRLIALTAALRDHLAGGVQAVVFCSDPATADALAEGLAERLTDAVHRHRLDDDGWRRFGEETAASVLVCDRTAEEGLNLQGRRRVVVHYDLPLNPNRIEQRLGRADRYGAGDAVPSLVLVCRDDPVELVWFDYLDGALRVFDRSVASLQYLIDGVLRALRPALLTDGLEALVDLIATSEGETGVIEREIRAIDQQDALDSLGAPPDDLVDALSDVDGDTAALDAATTAWVETMLQFRRAHLSLRGYPAGVGQPFRYLYATDDRRTLIPLATFMTHCAPALDLEVAPKGVRAVPTIPYVFGRRAALSRQARADGVGLLRYGDPFIAGLTEITEADDRGRSSAMWRYDEAHEGIGPAEIYLRFNFIVEADTAVALQGLRLDATTGAAAVRRRADMALPPFFETVWLDQDLAIVDDPRVIARLIRPFTPDAVGPGHRDLNINSQRWRRLERLGLPLVEAWSQLCHQAREAAERSLRGQVRFTEMLSQAEGRAAEVERRRLGQLRARIDVGGSAEEDLDELRLEEALSAALRAGVRAPQLRVDTIGAVFLSGDRRATDTLSGDA